MSPKNPAFPEDRFGVEAVKPPLTAREPTPGELAEEENLLAEDLAAFEKELSALGVKNKPADPEKSRVKRLSAPPASPRMAGGRKKKNQPRRANRPQEVQPSNVLSLKQVFSLAKQQMLSAGIIPVGVYDRGQTGEPISNREAAKKIMELPTADAVALARILLSWRPERVYNGQQFRSILKLLQEGRRASIPHILEAIVTNPSDVQRDDNVESVTGGIRRKIRSGADEWMEVDAHIDPQD